MRLCSCAYPFRLEAFLHSVVKILLVPQFSLQGSLVIVSHPSLHPLHDPSYLFLGGPAKTALTIPSFMTQPGHQTEALSDRQSFLGIGSSAPLCTICDGSRSMIRAENDCRVCCHLVCHDTTEKQRRRPDERIENATSPTFSVIRSTCLMSLSCVCE